ncbi:hypothetical protein H8B13_18535 [Hymenobacter sp. BT188]|uniref:hypothetical protein n=1 Tax=Hymenobacter sp. BT188 TaxID=2763504 RepID=UPI0016518AA8|nr:hypothetical protein [Hymenobacter sp. BT188]MBC6608827.1 hypothetical protein [Hymenobacter sp. BT188]
MNGAHLHLLLNHLPILGSLFGLLQLLLAVVRQLPGLPQLPLYSLQEVLTKQVGPLHWSHSHARA